MSDKIYKKTADIRETFQSYFEKNGHIRVPSASIIPERDPTLLFINAGMAPFKDLFLGLEKRDYNRATSVQKCVRAGGKHNDLENVGFTARHNTFFEMLGNFSFGDYFKKDAIHFAWDFVTRELGLPKDRLRVSVHTSDDEAADIWHKQEGVPRDRIVRFDEDNFWSMGDTGPCGPCSEIFWDQGREVDGDRWLEFWNCVFMQYNRDESGNLNPLPKPSVDTGMGLERMATILQSVESNYEIDLMAGLMAEASEKVRILGGRSVNYLKDGRSTDASALRVIVDHLRSTSFLIADGVLPSNEGRGYVLRRILRRALRFSTKLGVNEPILGPLFPALQKSMGSAYPELIERADVVQEILKQEEEKFLETLNRGLELLDSAFEKSHGGSLDPSVVFKLYDTFGFPTDLTELIAREKNFKVDHSAVNMLMEKAKENSKGSWQGSGQSEAPTEVRQWQSQGIFPELTAYRSENAELGGRTVEEKSQVLALHLIDNNRAWVSLSPSPFYGESGGQVGDRGSLKLDDGLDNDLGNNLDSDKTLQVLDTQKPYDGGLAVLVAGAVSKLKVGQSLRAEVDAKRREDIRAHHTSTHLLHAALRKYLGDHVHQAGSLVDDQRLRFDYSQPKAPTPEQLQQIENWVNAAIEAGRTLTANEKSFDEAVADGAMALFGEKYGDRVRVIQIPGLSTELCGGCHVEKTSDIRVFKILSESAVAAGTRRIEAVSGRRALEWFAGRNDKLQETASLLKSPADAIPIRVGKLLERNRELEREIDRLKQKLASGASTSEDVIQGQYKGLSLKVHKLDDADVSILRKRADALRRQEPESLHVLWSPPTILVTCDPKTLATAHAGNFLKELTLHFGGRGGGRDQTAQGQLPDMTGGAEALAEWAGKQK